MSAGDTVKVISVGFKWKKAEECTPEKIDKLVKKDERISFRG